MKNISAQILYHFPLAKSFPYEHNKLEYSSTSRKAIRCIYPLPGRQMHFRHTI